MDKQNTISITIPNPVTGIGKMKSSLLLFASEIYNGPIRRGLTKRNIVPSFKNIKFKFPRFNKKLFIKIALPLIVVVVFVIGIVSLLRSIPSTQADPNANTQTNISLPKPIAEEKVNKAFTFPIRDDNAEEVGTFNYVIENAELRKQIIVQGKRATAVEGRVFLILNLKITNNLAQQMDLPSRSYIRIVVNNNDKELLAADIHNDPVEVLGKATKYTRLGLAINESDAKKPIKLLVGEVEGEKQTIELHFN